MDFLITPAAENKVSVKDTIRNALQDLPRDQQLSKLIDFFEAASNRDAQLTELIAEAWDYLNVNTLWNTRYSSLEDLKRDIDYDYSLRHVLGRHQANAGRRKKEMQTILHNWNQPPDTALPSDLQPPTFSEKFLRSLAALSKISELNTAIPLLRSAVPARISTPLLQKHNYLLTSDISDVIKELQTPKPNAQTNAQDGNCNGEDRDKEDDYGDDRDDEDENEDESNEDGDDEDGADKDGSGEGGDDEDGRDGERDDEEDESEGDGDSGGDGEDGQAGVEEGQVGNRTRKRELKKRRRRKGTAICRCSVTLTQDIQSMKGKNCHLSGLKLLEKAIKAGLGTLCRTHLRGLAPVTAGLQNNISNSKLQERLQLVWTNQQRLDWLRRRNPRWFLKKCRPQSEADCLIVYRYPPLQAPIFQLDEVRVFERFAGPGTWSVWERDGTIIIPGLFSFLAQLTPEIDIEFDLYRHHHRSLPGRSRLGWLRNMFYSITQQTVRQDPIWYAISAAARPDKNWRLVTYPYITKDTDPGENTGFLHLDLNTTQYVKDGSGGNLLSSSIAIDDEQPDGCTIVVPGFHHQIHEWHKRLIDRGEDTAGFTTNCSAAYRAQDRRDWGEPVPMPCPALGLRLTRPEIIHGSTPHSYRRRRSLFAWHTGIDNTHTELDLKGTLSWNNLATCHRDLEAPSREPSGQAPRYGLPGFRFPGSIIVGSSSAIGDALVGRRKWTDPQVLQERDILLGDNNEDAHSYVSRVRAEMVKCFKVAFEKLEVIETEAFGGNSYFHRKKFGLPVRSGNDSEESDEDLPV
ncbi:MAG: hypothetical protein M1839_008584 [Geoglossum umbratile]|nr:MAG: hypothetical protein M1839_008584 [Geoglossum umbratile]